MGRTSPSPARTRPSPATSRRRRRAAESCGPVAAPSEFPHHSPIIPILFSARWRRRPRWRHRLLPDHPAGAAHGRRTTTHVLHLRAHSAHPRRRRVLGRRPSGAVPHVHDGDLHHPGRPEPVRQLLRGGRRLRGERRGHRRGGADAGQAGGRARAVQGDAAGAADLRDVPARAHRRRGAAGRPVAARRAGGAGGGPVRVDGVSRAFALDGGRQPPGGCAHGLLPRGRLRRGRLHRRTGSGHGPVHLVGAAGHKRLAGHARPSGRGRGVVPVPARQ